MKNAVDADALKRLEEPPTDIALVLARLRVRGPGML